jgi:ferredoxin
MAVRCIFCSRLIEEEIFAPDPYEDDDDDMPKKKPMEVCLRCQAKLKHEAEGTQKIPKPM